MTEENNIPMMKKWMVAARPFSFTASTTAVLLGAAIAYHSGHSISWGLLGLTLLGVICFHTAANLINDIFDYKRGLDTEVMPTSGAVVRGWLTERQVFSAAFTLIAIGCVCGLLLVREAGFVILGLGIVGVIIVLFYTGSGMCLKYMGLGDLAIFIAFALLPVFGAYWVQVQEFSWKPFVWCFPLGSYTVAILHANNWRDIESDKANSCTTMASMLGPAGSRVYYRLLVIGPFALVAAYVVAAMVMNYRSYAPLMALISFLALPLALKLASAKDDNRELGFLMLDGRTAQTQLVFGLLLPLSFVLSRLLNIN
ncbi:1,4-dihydroxy-2-naphthoate octaprenyltransferase [bacterium B17]|nr:1,4-dihydroxy-2-naphthoate octaprenyltransferase [bacterium B17]